jgi:prophage maintenance system killer protein
MIRDRLPSGTQIVETHDVLEQTYDLDHKGAAVPHPDIHCSDIVRETRDNHFDPHDRAAYLLRRLITAHLFEDANKRTAWTTILEYLDRHGIEPANTEKEAVEPVLDAIRAFDVDELADWLETGEIDESKFNP